MNRRLIFAAAAASALGIMLWPGSAQAQLPSPRLAGVLEYYLWAYQQGDGVTANQHARYISLKGDVSQGFGFTAGHLVFKGTAILDENCLEIGKADGHLRVGRFRPAFGIYTWDDNYYIPLLRAPVVRNNRIGNGLVQNRLDTGVQVSGGPKSLQYEIGVVDDGSNPYQLMAARPNHVVARLQTDQGRVILGVNSLVRMDNATSTGTRLFGIDWRWTVPQIQLRGEVFGGRYRGGNIAAYYTDLYYHPVRLYRTTFGLRAEATAGSQGVGQLYTLGLRQIISPMLALQVSRSWGNNVAPTAPYCGWAMQAMTSVHF